MKCQPLALILILFSIGHKAVRGRAAWSQVADRLAAVGTLRQVLTPLSLSVGFFLPTSIALGSTHDKEQVDSRDKKLDQYWWESR